MVQIRCFAFLLLLAPATVWAQSKVPVEIEHFGDDVVGRGVVYGLKEGIRGSQAMILTTDASMPRMRIVIITVDDTRRDPGNSSALSVSYLYHSPTTPIGGAFITATVHTCGRARIDDCARSILANIDREVDFLRVKWPGLWRTLHR